MRKNIFKSVLMISLLLFTENILAKNSVDCVAQAVFHEAVGEPILGQIAVAQVILQRVSSKRYPETPCGVVLQKRKGICHFSFLCVKKDLSVQKKDIPRKNLAENIAECVLSGECLIPKLRGVTMYYACAGRYSISKPSWDWTKLKFKAKIGNHCFYEEVG